MATYLTNSLYVRNLSPQASFKSSFKSSFKKHCATWREVTEAMIREATASFWLRPHGMEGLCHR